MLLSNLIYVRKWVALFTYKNAVSDRNINGQYADTVASRMRHLLSYASVQLSVYWRTIKCCHRIKSITTADIADVWNNIHYFSFSLSGWQFLSRSLRQSQSMAFAIISSKWLRTTEKLFQSMLMAFIDSILSQQPDNRQQYNNEHAHSHNTYIIYHLSTNTRNKIITTCTEMERKWFN